MLQPGSTLALKYSWFLIMIFFCFPDGTQWYEGRSGCFGKSPSDQKSCASSQSHTHFELCWRLAKVLLFFNHFASWLHVWIFFLQKMVRTMMRKTQMRLKMGRKLLNHHCVLRMASHVTHKPSIHQGLWIVKVYPWYRTHLLALHEPSLITYPALRVKVLNFLLPYYCPFRVVPSGILLWGIKVGGWWGPCPQNR